MITLNCASAQSMPSFKFAKISTHRTVLKTNVVSIVNDVLKDRVSLAVFLQE